MTGSRNGIPKALSPGEELFALHMRIHNLEPEREYLFSSPRKYRFDFCWPDKKLAVEIEGGTQYGKSRHTSGNGYAGDCEKYNLAVRLGWHVLRYTTAMVQSGQAEREVVAFLQELKEKQ